MAQGISEQAAQLHRAVSTLVKQYQCRDRNDLCCYGITVAQCYALEAIGEHGTLTMQALAAQLHLAVSTVTRTVDHLVEKQLVARQISARDRRVCCVCLTAHGVRLLQAIHADLLAREEAILQRLPAASRDHVLWAIAELARAIDAWRQTPQQGSGTQQRGTRMATVTHDEVRQAVQQRYATIAATRGAEGCCGGPSAATLDDKAHQMGYSAADTSAVPSGANLGLGCGNPVAIASLRPGETVLDLGSGAGFDCFLAAAAVGATGRVIGVDMTPEMVRKARENAVKGNITNVEFRLGEIEHLPVADASVDVILSNCVINLSPEKPQVFREAFRVLKPGGRLAIADIVASAPFPEAMKQDLALRSCCVSGASLIEEVEQMLRDAGFTHIRIQPKDESKTFIREWVPGSKIEDYLVSATIAAVKP